MNLKFEYQKKLNITAEVSESDIESIFVTAIVYKKGITIPESTFKNHIYYVQKLKLPFEIPYDSINKKLLLDNVIEKTKDHSSFLIADGMKDISVLKLKIICFECLYPNEFHEGEIDKLAKLHNIHASIEYQVKHNVFNWHLALDKIGHPQNDGSSYFTYRWKKEFIETRDKAKYFI